MPPTQSTVTAASTNTPLAKAMPTHRASIPAMVVLALFLSMMAALAIGVILRQRRATASLKLGEGDLQEKHHLARIDRGSWFARFKSWRPTAVDTDCSPTAVGALHATSVLLAAAPCQAFSSPMTMHFKIPLEDKTILILGAPWFPFRCCAQCCGAPVTQGPYPSPSQPNVAPQVNLASCSAQSDPAGMHRRERSYDGAQHYPT